MTNEAEVVGAGDVGTIFNFGEKKKRERRHRKKYTKQTNVRVHEPTLEKFFAMTHKSCTVCVMTIGIIRPRIRWGGGAPIVEAMQVWCNVSDS